MGTENSQLQDGLMSRAIGLRGTVGSQRGSLGEGRNPTEFDLTSIRPSWDRPRRSNLEGYLRDKILAPTTGCTVDFVLSPVTSVTPARIDATVHSGLSAEAIESGEYVFPVAAPWKFRDSWRDRRPYRDKYDKNGYLLKKAYHEGVDIFSEIDQKVYAITDGTVVAVNKDEKNRTGKQIFLRGADGHQYGYIHVDKIQVTPGQKVKKRDVIAFTGRTGILSSDPHTHFQIREAGTKKLVDPFEMLVRIAGFTPVVRSTPENTRLTYYHHYGDFGVVLIPSR